MYGQCGKCELANDKRICRNPDGVVPGFCCSKLYQEALRNAIDAYEDEAIRYFAVEASKQEKACYQNIPDRPGEKFPVKPRIIEIIEFCKRMHYKRLGFAFCGGLHKEASAVHMLLEAHGFEVISVMCKVGGVDKCKLGLADADKIYPNRHESMCNPIGQAKVLNTAETDFNILMGLCVGHDSLFLKYSKAMCTVFAVKDRVLGHNPLAAIYTEHSYYKHIKGDK